MDASLSPSAGPLTGAGGLAPTPAGLAPTPAGRPVETCDKGHPTRRGMPWYGAVCLVCDPAKGYPCDLCRQPRYCCCC